jgi:hypothetical protein
VPAEYPLTRAGKGFVHDARTFVARIAEDGAVTFKDRHVSFDTPADAIRAAAKQVGSGKPPPERFPRLPDFRADPREYAVRRNDPNHWQDQGLIGLGAGISGRMDLTDELMRLLGQDPYAYEKAKFMRSTSLLRTRMAADHRKQVLKEALEALPRHLAKILEDERFAAVERRRIIFLLWSECDDTAAGARARAIIELFVRQRLAPSSPGGYVPAELDELNANHARRFEPYSTPEGPAPPPGDPDAP